MITSGRGPVEKVGLPFGRDQRGAAVVEVVLVVPALMLMLALLVAGGRLWYARTVVADAGYAAARAGSLAATAAEARQAATSAGRQALATAGMACTGVRITVSTGAFRVPAGRPATVRAEVGCDVPLRDVALPGLPGRIRLSGTGSAALDTYRSRG
ncbi:MAG TPA: TadE/TadG family type IV pilus assembly protein [Microlunatus sp.]|nr:TadE/TadG family type IV pilus assembly protein [Microlunatus sp.]